MATLSVPTHTSTQIVITSSDYASGHGDKYSFYSAGYASGSSNQLGESGLAEWYHGAAAFSSGTSTNSTANQVGAGRDTTSPSNGGGLCTPGLGYGVACTGSGSAFAVTDANNTVCQIVHLKGATGATVEEKFWVIWANGTHSVPTKNVAAQAIGAWAPGLTIHSTWETSVQAFAEVAPGFSGPNLGVVGALSTPTSGFGSAGQGTFNDGQACVGSGGSGNSSAIAAGLITVQRLLLNGYDNAITSTICSNFYNEFVTHGGASNTLTVSTGSKTTSGTDLFGTASTTWTDGFDPERSAYILAASSNHINIGGSSASNWGIDGTTAVKRYRPCYIVTSWTASGAPVVTLGGTAQTLGTDYQYYNDTANSVLYLCLLKDIAGTEGALDVQNAQAAPPRPTIVRQAVTRAAVW